VSKPISFSSHMTNDRVLRDGTYHNVSVKEVVPGDVLCRYKRVALAA
jgi:magnesium-transporting ATPase (P-type)